MSNSVYNVFMSSYNEPGSFSTKLIGAFSTLDGADAFLTSREYRMTGEYMRSLNEGQYGNDVRSIIVRDYEWGWGITAEVVETPVDVPIIIELDDSEDIIQGVWSATTE